ncbi:PAS domain S-box protein, partial [archaeon]|nr:PAS domain S-box protein [archaeon]
MYTEGPSENVFIRERKAPDSMSLSQQNTGKGVRYRIIPKWNLLYAVFGPVLLFIVVLWVHELFPVELIIPGTKSFHPDIPGTFFITILSIMTGSIIYLLSLRSTGTAARVDHDNEQEKILSNILIQDSPTLFLAIHSDGSIIMASNSLLNKLGYTRDEVMGENCLSLFIPPREHEEVFKSIMVLLESRNPQKNETTILSKDGRQYLLQWEARSAYREDGSLHFIYIAGVDITEQKEAQISLQLSEERYRSFIQNLRGIAYQADIDNIPIFLHGDIEQITGYCEQDFLTGSVMITDLILPEDHDGIREKLENLRTIPDYSTELTYRIRTKDGQIRWIRDFIQNTCENPGKPTGIMGIVYDITLTKEAEASLLKSNERYSLLAENVKDVIWAVDNNIRYTYISPSVEKMRGYTMEEVMTMPMEKMFTPQSYIKMQKILQQVKTMQAMGEISDIKKSLTFEVELLCRD